MISSLKNFIESKALFAPNDRLLLAVSGGLDSMVMAEMMYSLGYSIAVAHMNFQLRGEESDLDEKFVVDWANEKGVTCHARKVSLSAATTSTQMAAREFRYAWFEELCEKDGYSKVLTAHHMDDSLETTLLNLVKGAGISGLAGIPAINGRIVRPMLCFEQVQLEEYARDHSIQWREDMTNHHSVYQRNYIRNQVIPLLKELNPSLTSTYNRSKLFLEAADLIIKLQAESLSIADVNQQKLISLDWLKKNESDAVLLYELIREHGFNFDQARDILGTMESGKMVRSSTHELWRDRETLVLRERSVDEVCSVTIPAPGRYQWKDWIIEVEERESARLESDPNVAIVDLEKLSWPITVAEWEDGDVMIPLGMTGHKKISDLFIDLKIPVSLKKTIPIFKSDGEIIWAGGLRMGDRFKVTPGSRRRIKIKLSKK